MGLRQKPQMLDGSGCVFFDKMMLIWRGFHEPQNDSQHASCWSVFSSTYMNDSFHLALVKKWKCLAKALDSFFSPTVMFALVSLPLFLMNRMRKRSKGMFLFFSFAGNTKSCRKEVGKGEQERVKKRIREPSECIHQKRGYCVCSPHCWLSILW